MSGATAPRLTLFHYWRSSSSWRVRWGFAIKRIPCDFVSVNLLDDETDRPEHRRRNPMGYVPALEIAQPGAKPFYLAESMAILHWADEQWPGPSLLPPEDLLRARARQLAEMINAGTQPLQNLNAQDLHSQDPAERKRWAQHWIREGLRAYETLVRETAGRFSVGDQVTMADLCLIPQVYNAVRFEVPLTDFPTIERINVAALATPACQASHPDRYAPQA